MRLQRLLGLAAWLGLQSAVVAAPAVRAGDAPPAQAPAPSGGPAAAPTAAAAPNPSVPSIEARSQAIDTAVWADDQTPEARRDLLIRAQVILDRAHFSPGVIDGKDGSNFRRALAAFEAASHVPGAPAEPGATAPLDANGWKALAAAGGTPVMGIHTITADDLKGPFLGVVPHEMAEEAKLPHLGYASPLQELAAAFHMDEGLLKSLNPTADFGQVGTRLLVARPGATPLPPVTRVAVDKTHDEVRAYGEGGALVATFPATVGSTARPAPTGRFAVRFVVHDPDYTYDPKRETFGDRAGGKLTIKPGPNNPVGSTWIDLTIETYGIHGSPDPTEVGKTASHGCVRLTNWDVSALGKAVKKGAVVDFVGQRAKPAKT